MLHKWQGKQVVRFVVSVALTLAIEKRKKSLPFHNSYN